MKYQDTKEFFTKHLQYYYEQIFKTSYLLAGHSHMAFKKAYIYKKALANSYFAYSVSTNSLENTV